MNLLDVFYMKSNLNMNLLSFYRPFMISGRFCGRTIEGHLLRIRDLLSFLGFSCYMFLRKVFKNELEEGLHLIS